MCSVGCGCDQCLRRYCISSLHAQSLFNEFEEEEYTEDFLRGLDKAESDAIASESSLHGVSVFSNLLDVFPCTELNQLKAEAEAHKN